MKTPNSIPTGGPFIYRPTCGHVPHKQPLMEFKEFKDSEFSMRYAKWLYSLPALEGIRKLNEMDNEHT